MAFGRLADRLRRPHEIGLDETQAAERIMLVRIEAGRDHDQVRAEVVQRTQDARRERLPERLAGIARAQRRVPDVADARLRQVAGAGEQRHLVGRTVEEVLVGPEDVLRAVAVVDVEIHDRDALGTVADTGVVGCDGGVREQAEAHGAVGLGVVPRRAHLAERVGEAARHHLVDRIEPGADGAQGGVHAAGRHHRIAVEVHAAVALLGDLARPLDAVQVILGMHAQDRVLHVVAQRRLGASQCVVALMRQHLVDGAHALRPFRMAEARVVVEEIGVCDQQCGHEEIGL